MRLFEQKERGLYATSNKWVKRKKHRVERRRAKQNPECIPCYRKYKGWQF
jgi:hypothetical protein